MSKATERTPRRRKPQSQIERSEVRTGIYVRRTVRSGGDPRDIETVMREYSDRHNRCRREWLSHVEQAARSIIDAGDSPDQTVHDASQALGLCRAVRHWIEQGDAAETAFEAFLLGLAVERIGVRPFEPLVIDGRTVREARSRGGKVRAAKCAERYPEYQPEIDRLVLQQGNTYSSACENAAGRFKRSKRHIEMHTKNPRKC